MAEEPRKYKATVRYVLNPNFAPEGENLQSFDCDKISYYWPASPAMNISSFVSPSPVGFSCIKKDTGECKQFLIYQLVDVTYHRDFEKMIEEETAKARAKMRELAEAHVASVEDDPTDLRSREAISHDDPLGYN